jgi:hypothetical protein
VVSQRNCKCACSIGTKDDGFLSYPLAFLNTGLVPSDARELTFECAELNVRDDGGRSALPVNGKLIGAAKTPETGTLLFAGRSALKTGYGSAAGAGLIVRLCVNLKVDAGAWESLGGDFAGDIPALSVAHGATCCPMDETTAVDIVLEYGRSDVTLAALARRRLIGLSRIMRFVGLPAWEDANKDGERPLRGDISGVACRSRRLMSCARSFVAASRRDITAQSVSQNQMNESVQRE